MRRFLRILIIMLSAALILPLLVPIPPLKDVSPPEQLAGEDSKFIQVNGLRVHYKDQGQGGSPLLLLHGFLASTFTWREVMAPLAEGRRVIAYDRPAFGITERPLSWKGQNPYGPRAQVDLLVGLMDSLAIDRAVLVGNSAGGTLSAAVALAHPERIRALILVDPAIYTTGGLPGWARPLLTLPQARRLGPLFLRNIRKWGLDFGKQAWHDPSKVTPDVLEGYTLPLRAQNWDRALWEFTAAGSPRDVAQRLEELHLPVLVVTGDDDRIVPTAQSIRLARELPSAELVVIPACGHVPQEECPAPFIKAVNDFLAGLPED